MNMRHVLVDGLQGFQTRKVDFNLAYLDFNFDFMFPTITLRGLHRTIARIAGVIPVPLSGEGNFTIILQNVHAVGVAKLSLRGGHLHMDDIVVGATIASANVIYFKLFQI